MPAEISIVHARALSEPCSPCAAYERLRSSSCPWLLESALRRPGIGRYSFVGADPYLVLRSFGSRVLLDLRRPARTGAAALPPGASALDHDPLAVVRSLLPPAPESVPREIEDLPFVGGAIAVLGYELATQIEPVGLHARDDLGLPDLQVLFVDRLAVFDHELRRAWAVGVGFGSGAGGRADARVRAERASGALAAGLRGLANDPEPGEGAPLARADDAGAESAASWASFDEAGYAKAVGEILNEIDSGNVYQANFTQRIDVACGADPFALYRSLRSINPAPFAACLELPDVAVVGSSPERFLRLGPDGAVQSRPIKGTRPRGSRPDLDAALADELARSVKDRAENLMIVDLVRNDLGRVCETGSVRVPSLMAVERYASVWQLVSTVEGRLAEDCDAIDLVRAAFPPGSMTGAPKIAAMRLLDRLEPVRRGVYAGALGYLDLRGGCDLSVVIRTALLKDGVAHLHVGGGVVADSNAVNEYRESLDKARALFRAIRSAEAR